ncbi:hypothetical protein RB195_008585 [Necator americanus]|uniref:Reverse transcriptase domain-containing protein n=1 Tax=Necator americanus TaxID=51031 RepID=A0ABR1CPB3_NECAM
MLSELNEAGKRIGLRINRKKTQFMKNAYCEDGGVQLEGSQIVETSSYVYLGRSMNMENDLKEELNRRIDGPAESSAGYVPKTSSTSLTKLENILDDNGEGTKRVEEMLGPTRPVKTGHLSK